MWVRGKLFAVLWEQENVEQLDDLGWEGLNLLK